jgi:hypothetical protein
MHEVPFDRGQVSVSVVLVHQDFTASFTGLGVQILIVTQPHEELRAAPVVECSGVRDLSESLKDDKLGGGPDVVIGSFLVERVYHDTIY